MRVKYSDSIEFKALKRLSAIRSTVVLRADFDDLGSYRQISRALKKLIDTKRLVKIGVGIYAKCYLSKYSNVPLIKNGVDACYRTALKRLGVSYQPGSAENEYNQGKSTQIPARNIVRLKTRCRRKIGYQSTELIFEKKINAK